MLENSELLWKVKGYPFTVRYSMNESKEIMRACDWCGENLTKGSYYWVGSGVIVFKETETATLFALTWT